MSLTIARRVHEKYPHLLTRNTGADCHQFTLHLIEELRAANFLAFLMCKTAGEGQYTPFGFQPREVKGFDGKTYLCTGVSHDAIWCDGRQFDTIGNANDGPEPFGSPGVPVWNPIPEQFWRPNNPPLKSEPVIINPPTPPLADYNAMGDDAFFVGEIGVPLAADMAKAGQVMNAGSASWIARTTFRVMRAFDKYGDHRQKAEIVKDVRNQWRAVLGLPPL